MGISSKQPANLTPQIELLYRDIKIQLEELQQLRPYREAVNEIIYLVAMGHYCEEYVEIQHILKKHGITEIKK